MKLQIAIDTEWNEPTYTISVYNNKDEFCFNAYPVPGSCTLDDLMNEVDKYYDREFKFDLHDLATFGVREMVRRAEVFLGASHERLESYADGGVMIYRIKRYG